MRDNDNRIIMLGSGLWLASAAIYLLTEAIAAAGFPGYSYASNFISDLGVPYKGELAGHALNSTLAAVMNFGFVAHGLLFTVASLVMLPGLLLRSRARIALLVFVCAHALGSLLIAVIHGGNREVANGTYIFHTLGATLAIVGGNLAVLTLTRHLRLPATGRGYRLTSYALVTLALVGLVLLVLMPHTPLRGVFERCCVYSIMVWELLTAAVILFWALRQRAQRHDVNAGLISVEPVRMP